MAGPSTKLDLILDRTIAGAGVPATLSSVTLRDTIMGAATALAASDDAAQPGPPALLERRCSAGFTSPSCPRVECIFEDIVQADRRQAGCVRYSFVRDGSQTRGASAASRAGQSTSARPSCVASSRRSNVLPCCRASARPSPAGTMRIPATDS